MKPLIILTGPTAVGKTALSLKIARALDGEIISADSMQVYKGMDIGTAKIKASEMQGVRHHLIDILSPFEEYNVALFKEHAKAAVEDIYSRGKIPVVAGGTGFYIQALLYDVDFKPEEEDSYRELLEERALTEEGRQELYDELMEKDPAAAEKIHKNNIKRVIRALDFYHKNNSPISTHNEIERAKKPVYDSHYFVLTMDRTRLYDRINLRVDQMISEGLVDEVKRLKESGLDNSFTSMQGIGYKEVLEYLNGSLTIEECIDNIKKDTRHFAKRQLTWFRRERDTVWIDKDEYPDDDAMLQYILKVIGR